MSFSTTSRCSLFCSPPSFLMILAAKSAALPSVRKYSGASSKKFNSSGDLSTPTKLARIVTKCALANGASISISDRNSSGSESPLTIASFPIFPSDTVRLYIANILSTSVAFISITINTPASINLAPRSTEPSPMPTVSSTVRMASSVSPLTKYSLSMAFAFFSHASGDGYDFFGRGGGSAGAKGSDLGAAVKLLDRLLRGRCFILGDMGGRIPSLIARLREEELGGRGITCVNPSSSTMGFELCLRRDRSDPPLLE
mmetsp:Transcript_18014/g.26738  ORF Transcript_18014/g.26738 Transcript_18014/m.26738 type:complete len:257 (-) Transcript_18014:1321-2091(-)